jgi:hypothetical protein
MLIFAELPNIPPELHKFLAFVVLLLIGKFIQVVIKFKKWAAGRAAAMPRPQPAPPAASTPPPMATSAPPDATSEASPEEMMIFPDELLDGYDGEEDDEELEKMIFFPEELRGSSDGEISPERAEAQADQATPLEKLSQTQLRHSGKKQSLTPGAAQKFRNPAAALRHGFIVSEIIKRPRAYDI